jgi:hypothetical protein
MFPHMPPGTASVSCSLSLGSTLEAVTIAYASFRMEPGYMIAGHASGIAAALAAKAAASVQGVPLAELQRHLRSEGQVLELREP